MFREIRIKNKKLDNAEEILKCGEYGVLATSGEDGYPYGGLRSKLLNEVNSAFKLCL